MKEQILEKMNIDSIVDLLNIIEYEKDITELSAQIIAEDGKQVKVEKTESSLTITMDGSPRLTVSAVPTPFNPYEKRDFNITYLFPDNARIEFFGTTNVDLEGIDKEELKDNLRIKYCSNNVGKSTLFNWFLIPNGIEISDDGIKYSNMLLSFDGKEIKKINDEEIPSKKDLDSFNYEEELGKVEDFLNDKTVKVNGITRKYIEGTMAELEKKQTYISRLMKDYETVTEKVSGLVDTREEFLDHLNGIDFRSNYLGFVRDWVAEFSKTRRYDKDSLMGKAYSKTRKNSTQE